MSGQDIGSGLSCDDVREVAGSYVLDALDPAEAASVRAHLATCPDAHAEVGELGGVPPALAESVPIVEPPAGLKARIMAAAAADLAERGGAPAIPAEGRVAAPTPAARPGPAAAQTVAAEPTPVAEPIAFPSPEARRARVTGASAGSWVMRIAAVVAIVALGGWGVLLNGQLESARAFERSVAVVLDAAAVPGSLRAILTADGGTGSGLAAIGPDGSVTLAMRDLVPTAGESVYEVWVIGSDGVPVAIAEFRVGDVGTGFIHSPGVFAADGIVLALTHEPAPGATVPTGPVVAKGVATAAS